ncbi:MAG: hypothetical protein HY984_01420 [Candidatus Magasanikbacteria bacterium]|nr:hypothetical protein [Candidatus Magasanikbacteria bacterium]
MASRLLKRLDYFQVLALFFLVAISITTPIFVFAKTPLKFDDSDKFLKQAVDPTGIKTDDVRTVSGRVIQSALLLVGLAFFILMVYGGFQWMTARGNEDQITKARNIVIAAVIGIAVILGAYAITNFVVNRTTAAALGAKPTP